MPSVKDARQKLNTCDALTLMQSTCEGERLNTCDVMISRSGRGSCRARVRVLAAREGRQKGPASRFRKAQTRQNSWQISWQNSWQN